MHFAPRARRPTPIPSLGGIAAKSTTISSKFPIISDRKSTRLNPVTFPTRRSSDLGASQNPSASDLNHLESPKSRSGSRNYVAASRSKLGEKRCILRRGQGALPRYQASGVLQLNPQPSVANSQSFQIGRAHV